MNERKIKLIASIGLLIGGILGMAGSFVPSALVRGIFWGVDGVALVISSSILTIYYFRKGYDLAASGFLVFAIGEALILSALKLGENVTTFGAGTALWAASLALISSQKLFPIFVRVTGIIASVLFVVVSVLIIMGEPIDALTKPLPYFAYPFFAFTTFGWAWKLMKKPSSKSIEP